jgi:Ca-activated chloride channel family protein
MRCLRGSIARVAAGALMTVATVSATDQRFRSGTVAVRVDVLVTDGKKLVTGLESRDFDVRDEGVVQNVTRVDVEQLPLNLILAFDTSDSVSGPRLASLVDAGRALVSSLRERDRVALLSFSARVRLLSPLTPSRLQILSALDRLSASGTTSVRDAAFAALSLRESDPGRTLVLIFTDGADNASWLTAPRVIEAAKRTDAVLYGVRVRRTITLQAGDTIRDRQGFLVSPLEPPMNVRIDPNRLLTFVADLADETGGRVIEADDDPDLPATFTRTLDEFRNRYVLSYTPTGVTATGWHRLEVKLKGKRGKVTARRGYFAE